MIFFLNYYLIPGLVLGCIYALGAIGLTLTFGIMRFANFSHGEFMTLGAYFTWSMVQLTDWHPVVFLPVSVGLTIIVVLTCHRTVFKPVWTAPPIILVVASFGLMLMIRSAIQFIWSVQPQDLHPVVELPLELMLPIRLLPKHALIIAMAVLLMFGVHYLLTRTKLGKAMRALSDSPELARITGIDENRVVVATWIIGGGLAAAAGIFLAVDTHVDTRMGFKVLLPIFAVTILGGIGKPYGAMAGGIVIGLVEELSSYPWIGTAPLISPAYKQGLAFVVLIMLLIWRPTGLMAGRSN